MKEQQESSQDTLEAVEKDSELIVFNDEVNTFNHVINTLIRVCKHSNEQAQQCTLICLLYTSPSPRD